MVTYGGMTGLVRGAVPTSDEVVVSLERRNRIEAVAPGEGTVPAQAGVPLQAEQEAAEAEGCLFPLDFGARGSATIGGASGWISAEHGIGMEKRKYLGLSRSRDEIRTMRLLKQALDPKGILNTGRVFPLEATG